jgi:RHS repeat-associated protein
MRTPMKRPLSAFTAFALFMSCVPFQYIPTAVASGSPPDTTYPPPTPPPGGCTDDACCVGASGADTPPWTSSDPVVFFHGEKYFEEVLAKYAEPYEPLILSVRHHGQSSRKGLFGSRWFLNWERTAELQGSYGTIRQIRYRVPGQRIVYYVETGTNTSVFATQDEWNSKAYLADGDITVELSCGAREIYSLESGHLKKYRDKGGNEFTFAYINDHRWMPGDLAEITDPLGRTITLNYDAATNLVSIVDWANRTNSFEYGASYHRLEAIIFPPTPEFPSGLKKKFYYNDPRDAYRVTGIGWNNDAPYQTISYGADRFVTNETFALRNPITFEYDFSNGRSCAVTYRDGSKDVLMYNTDDFLTEWKRIRKLSASGACPETSWGEATNTWSYLRNGRGQTTNSASSVGLTIQRAYNSLGLVTNRVETDSNTGLSKTWEYSYDSNGCGKSVQSITDPLGNTTTIYYEFDEASLGDLNGDGNTSGTRALPVKIVQPAVTNALTGTLQNPTTLVRYDDRGRVTWMRDASSRTNSFTYETGKSRPVTATISGGNASLTYHLSYDSLDRLTQIITPTGWTNTLAYDARDRLTNYTSNLASVPTIGVSHDQWGNVTTANYTPGSDGGVDGEIAAVYDALGALTAVTNQLGFATTISYSSQRKVQTITRPLGREDKYEYRADGMLKRALDALDNPTDFCYDQFGRVKQVRDANGHSYYFEYDAWSRITTQTFEDASYEVYGYDAMDHLTSWRNRAGQTTTYQYDALGRLVKEVQPERTFTYKYLLTGELWQETGGYYGSNYYFYDDIGRLVTSIRSGRWIGYAYNAQGQRNGVTYPDITTGNQGALTISEQRDSANRLTKIKSADGQTTYFERAYDGMGRIKQDKWFSGVVTKNYLYDAAGQLTNWTATGNNWSRTNNLSYDAGGRIVTQEVNATTNVYRYDLTDQLTNGPSYSATYDAVGNRLTADGWAYTNNSVNAYTSLTQGSTVSNLSYDSNGNLSRAPNFEFTHDSQGRLTAARRVEPYDETYDCSYDNRQQLARNYNTGFVRDPAGQLLALENDDGSRWAYYVYADGIDRAVLMRAGDDSSEGVYALITDHLSSVVAILDSNGDLVETYEYTPFGKTTIKNSSGTVISESVLNNVLGFTGREFDTNTGLYYYRNRWYSPDLGRFLEPDPIGLAGWDLNLYRYVTNLPIVLRDPLGLAPKPYPPPSPFPTGGADPCGDGGTGVGADWGSLLIDFYNWVDLYIGAKTSSPPVVIIKVPVPVKAPPGTPIIIAPPPPGVVKIPVYITSPEPPSPSPLPGPVKLDPGPPTGVIINVPPATASK